MRVTTTRKNLKYLLPIRILEVAFSVTSGKLAYCLTVLGSISDGDKAIEASLVLFVFYTIAYIESFPYMFVHTSHHSHHLRSGQGCPKAGYHHPRIKR